MKDYLIKKVFHSFLFTSILGILSATLGMLVDGIVIKKLGQECVSAFGFSTPLFILIAALAGIFSNGGTSCCSNYIGRGERDKIKLNFTVTCAGTLIVGILVTVVCIPGCETLARLLGAKGELVGLTGEYIRGIGFGGIFIMLSQVVMIYVRTDNDSVLGFISVVCMTITNVVLDIVMGLVLKWGLFGMGLATSISYLVCLLVCLIHFFRKDNLLKFTRPSGGLEELKEVLLTGTPSALNRGCITIRGIILNRRLLVLGGSIAVSALSVQNTVNQLLGAVTMGVGMTVVMMAGIFYGERDESALGRTLKVSLRTGILLSAAVSVLTAVFARPIVGLLLQADEEGMALAVRCLRLFTLSLPLSLICVALLNFYQCTRNLFMANFLCVCHGLVFVALYALALSPFLGVDGVWISFFCAEATTLAAGAIVLRIRTKKMPKQIRDLLLLPEGFEPDQERMLNISIKNDMKYVMELSERISEFCRKHTDDVEKIERLSLCIEEMVGNIVTHGFKDKKEHFIDIKIIMAGEDIIFRIRDDGAAFNPLQAEISKEQYGISIIRKMAKDMEYRNAIGLNNLTVTL